MKGIYVIGDVHMNFLRLASALEEVSHGRNVVCCGEFGYWPDDVDFEWKIKKLSDLLVKREQRILFCDGNHEDLPKLFKLAAKSKDDVVEISPMIFYVKRGGACDVEGVKFLFLGGANSVDKNVRFPGYNWFPEEDIKSKDVEKAIRNLRGVDVVVTHTCPEEVKSIAGEAELDSSTLFNMRMLSVLFQYGSPTLWYFSHWHREFELFTKNVHFVGLNAMPRLGWIKEILI